MKPVIYTIGHSAHPIERFLALLKQHGVTALADVRSMPASRFHKQFNKAALSASLKENGIAYVFLGNELGARTKDSSLYENGHVSFDKLSQTPLFKEGIERVLKGAETHRVAIMCAEKEPLDCHRTLLVARHLMQHGADILHILGNGALETHQETMARLRGGQTELFSDDAYRAQGARISYKKEDLAGKI